MVYSYKEYKPVFDTPIKRQQEIDVARKIIDLLNEGKYDNLEEFMSKNATFKDFLNKSEMDVVIKRFGNTMSEDDFKKVLDNFKILTKEKNDFQKDNIKTTNIDDKQFVSLKNNENSYILDNSSSKNDIEKQMADIQQNSESFQTSDVKKNTENMFKELGNTKKGTLNLQYLDGINVQSLNEEEKNIYDTAVWYQENINKRLRLDVKKQVIVDDENNIMRIEKIDGRYNIRKDENQVE